LHGEKQASDKAQQNKGKEIDTMKEEIEALKQATDEEIQELKF
jgi:hypothetical protein